ncbi:MAG: S8 family peptidase [Vicinamibacterales bacterium]
MKRLLLTLPLVLMAVGTPVHTGQQSPSVSSDLKHHPSAPHTHRIIVQGDDPALDGLLGLRLGVLHRRVSGALALEVTDAQLDALEHNPQVTHISGDLPVFAHATTSPAAVTNQVTQATSVWKGKPGLLGLLGTPGYSGTGVGVAVLDSGIAPHTALGSRVVAHVNFVSTEPGVTGDPFGHGTHVAGIVAGSTTAATKVTNQFAGGSAPAATLIDVRVLGSDGSGLTSDVIAGINWVIANKARYHIRVLNLSLGHPVTEPAATDPLVQAVEQAVTAGITTVVSAGNYGMTLTGAPELGGITSPGNAPDVITVGAIDTNYTTSTSDDVVAPYSSRGPAEYDTAVKPDLVAPGTHIVSCEVPGSYLSVTYPSWHVAGSGTNAYIRLSGTSMATAVVSGGAALLLNAVPSMSPAQVKLALQMGARFMPQAGLIAGGVGSVNFEQSLTLAHGGLLSSLLNTLTSLLGVSSGATYRDKGTLIDGIYNRSGIHLLDLSALLGLLGNPTTEPYGVLELAGTSNPLGSSASNYIVWGNVSQWSNSYYIVWGNSIQSPDGQYIVWGNDDVSDSNYIVWGNSVGGGH